MSHHHHHSEVKAEFFAKDKASSLAIISLVVGIAGLAVSLAWGLLGGGLQQLAYSYLFSAVVFFTITVGSLFWVFVHHATDAEWSVLVRRQLENVGALIPILGVLFIGVLVGAGQIYSWWHIDPATDEVLHAKAAYLNKTGFYARAVFYLVALSVLALLVRRNSAAQDSDGNPVYTVRNRVLSFIGIPVLGLSVTFAAFDWLMSLDFRWFSTMWGVYIFAGGAGAAMGLLVLIVTFLKSRGYLKLVTLEHYHVMGKFMLAFCVFWAYIGYSQYMLIWYANMPEETIYYIRRTVESWWYLSLFLVIGHFFIPFPILLFQATKKNPKFLCIVAAWLLLMHVLDLYIVVMPMLHQKGFQFSILDLTTLVGIAGVLAAGFFKFLPKTSLFPVRDPRIEESIRLSN